MRLVYSAVFMVAIGELLGVIRLLSDEGNRAVLGTDQVQVKAMQGMTAFNDIWYVGQFLFGLHLLLLGYLAYRSGYIPRVLGALLVISGLGYATDSFGAVLSEGPWTDITTFTFLGEFLLALWLVIRARGVAAGAAQLEAAQLRGARRIRPTPKRQPRIQQKRPRPSRPGLASSAHELLRKVTPPCRSGRGRLSRSHQVCACLPQPCGCALVVASWQMICGAGCW